MSVLLKKRIQLIATTLKSRSDQYKADLIVSVGQTLFGNQETKMNAIIDKEFPFSKATEAHLYMESNASIGKILLKYDLD